MASIKNLGKQIIKEPASAGVEIERKGLGDKGAGQITASPTSAGAANKANPAVDPFTERRSDARPVSGKAPRPTDKSGE